MMPHHDLMDVLVAAFTFGNTVIGAIIGGVVMLRQSRNIQRQTDMHAENQDAIKDLKTQMMELHK